MGAYTGYASTLTLPIAYSTLNYLGVYDNASTDAALTYRDGLYPQSVSVAWTSKSTSKSVECRYIIFGY